jgi:hypothetical protein
MRPIGPFLGLLLVVLGMVGLYLLFVFTADFQ